MAKVTTVFASDDKEVVASIQKMNAALVKLTEENRRLAEKSKAAAKAGEEGWSKSMGAVASYVSSLATVGAAYNLINRSLQEQLQLEEKIASLHKTAAGSEREFLRNLGTVTPEQRAAALGGLKGVSERTGVPMSQLYGAGAYGLSAAGGDYERANAAVEQAARIAPESPEKMQAMAGAIIDLGKAYKGLSVDEATARGVDLLIGMSKTSSVPDVGELARTAPRAVQAGVVADFTPEQASALFDTFTQTGLKKGEPSATAAANLMSRMEAFLPREATGWERFEKISGDDKMRKKFLATLEQSVSKPFSEQILTPGTREHEMFRDLSASKVADRGGADAFIRGLDTTPLQRTAGMERRLATRIENAELQNAAAANNAIIRGKVDTALLAAGESYGDRSMLWMRMLASSDQVGTGISQLEGQRDFMKSEWTVAGDTPERRGQLEALNSIIDELKAIRAQRDSNPNTHIEDR